MVPVKQLLERSTTERLLQTKKSGDQRPSLRLRLLFAALAPLRFRGRRFVRREEVQEGAAWGGKALGGAEGIPATSTLMEVQEFGEMTEHVDEVNFALDGLRKGQPLRIRSG
ncbi:uncharacterized protein LOC106764533 isoform X2 [Vigna radiata var. radiata]|uniref:Uncharacterized protein LOC106764533 isoform X2 n=1 Tax=Vigna radiata var. radiata TaxID=3916 RepID=A0A3Q0F4U0_VIGRR|nr:uncharacterized protein LOC106764533 isoform X2 [Vigna radiata var. radiata]